MSNTHTHTHTHTHTARSVPTSTHHQTSGTNRTIKQTLTGSNSLSCQEFLYYLNTRTHTHTNMYITHDYKLTELLQKPLVSFIKEQFAGRLVVIKPDFSMTREMSAKQRRRLEGEVTAAGVSLNLILLDCDASFPEDLAQTNIHPHFVYIEVARLKVSVCV